MPLFSMKEESIERLNSLGSTQTPLVFLLDFALENSFVWTLPEAQAAGLHFALGEVPRVGLAPSDWITSVKLVDETRYRQAFAYVHQHLAMGDSFLVNLTASHEITLGGTLEEIYHAAAAKCKVWWEDKWVCFTPEPFVHIDPTGVISSFPMKGTAEWFSEADEERLRQNQKELYEHTTIVDLIRNDLSRVALRVWVDRFRYIEKIPTADGRVIMQLSSCIQGTLTPDWRSRLGHILAELLPAGSISGAPKPKTLDIIHRAERLLHPAGERGYYTGIFGYFDGQTLQTFVLIRFIEQTPSGFVFKSGGGITYLSDPTAEYHELAAKVYVPVL